MEIEDILMRNEQLVLENEALRQQIQDLKNGYEGSCYACEPVGNMNKTLRNELNSARREICNIVAGKQGKSGDYSPDAVEHANLRGWNCFEEDSNG